MVTRLTLTPVGPKQMINEDVEVLTLGCAIERIYRFRNLFDPLGLLLRTGAVGSYLAGENAMPHSVAIDPPMRPTTTAALHLQRPAPEVPQRAPRADVLLE